MLRLASQHMNLEMASAEPSGDPIPSVEVLLCFLPH